MAESTTCPVCASESVEKVLSAKDYTVSGEMFDIWHCGVCTFRFTHPVPDEAEIGPYYKSEEYISHTNTGKGLINSMYQRVRKITLRKKVKLVRKVSGKAKGTLLDIGAGTGHFLGAVKAAGWNAQGLEPDEDARKVAKEAHGLDLRPTDELMSLEPGAYDVVSMWHVLEHVHRLDAYLERIHEILKADGTLLIAVPNYDSLDARKYGAGWAAYDVPRHLYHFNPKSMEYLLSRHGFKLAGMRRMPFDSFYVGMLSEKYRSGGMVRGVWIGFRSWWVSLFNKKRCSSLIYVIRKKDVR